LINYLLNHTYYKLTINHFLDYPRKILGYTAVFLVIALIFNYSLDFEDSIIDSYYGQEIRMLYYFLMYSIGYYFTCFIIARFQKQYSFLREYKFWITSAFGLLVLSFDKSFYYHIPLIQENTSQEFHLILVRMTKNAISLITILLPLFLFHWLDRFNRSQFYGLLTRNTNWKFYGLILLILVPLIMASSLLSDLSNYYPRYKPNQVGDLIGWPSWMVFVIFELLYAWDFVSIELLFRGFLVLGMIKYLEKFAILPMVTVYCMLHFGKPATEAISSIFGGYLLGLLTLFSGNIWGGIVLHVGVAWSMEAGALLQKVKLYIR